MVLVLVLDWADAAGIEPDFNAELGRLSAKSSSAGLAFDAQVEGGQNAWLIAWTVNKRAPGWLSGWSEFKKVELLNMLYFCFD